MSHPSLGQPPLDLRAGSPDAAKRIRDADLALATRALQVAVDRDATFRGWYDEAGLRARLHDGRLLAERVALCVASDDPQPLRDYAEQVAPVYRRKRVPMDHLIDLCEGLRVALPGTISAAEMPSAEAGLDAAIEVFRWHRRLAGDARRRNKLLQFIYKGG